MFCYQCEQTSHNTGCTNFGVCGKDPDVAALQDLIVYASSGLAMYGHRLRKLGVDTPEINNLIMESLFATVTNVNFDPKRLAAMIKKQHLELQNARNTYLQTCQQQQATPENLGGPATWQMADSIDGLIEQGIQASVRLQIQKHGADIAGLKELIMYGLKGTVAYAHHAKILGAEDQQVYDKVLEIMDFLTNEEFAVDELLANALAVGEINYKVLELLDRGHIQNFGKPEPTEVRIHPVKGKAILVSGHDLKDLLELLKQTEGKGVNVYTHGEMLPAHSYPELKKFSHLVGNFGGAWMEQRKEFAEFPGSILMTTNCIQKPKESYQGRLFTSGVVGWPGVQHVENRDFAALIDSALALPGFTEDSTDEKILVGFGHDTVMGVADKVVEAIQGGHLRHLFLIGGCDGAESVRNYYTDFAEEVPEDCAILTLGCGKYRFNKLQFGDIGGIPRLLDMGQCNDAYSAIQVAVALAQVFKTDVNKLPLSLIISWFEQKAVCILLTLLYLGIQDIRIGPALPAFITPNVLKVLQEKYNLMGIGNASQDLQTILS
ncbi:hydroxylamine reductase [Candidatus Uabimicrobium amorphum]